MTDTQMTLQDTGWVEISIGVYRRLIHFSLPYDSSDSPEDPYQLPIDWDRMHEPINDDEKRIVFWAHHPALPR